MLTSPPLESFALMLSEDDTFTQTEAPVIVDKFVCGVCHGPLYIVDQPGTPRVLVICPEHGNVCHCGRVTHATVSIEMERAYKTFYSAIRALPDLWGSLIQQGFERTHAFKIRKDYVCAVCGSPIFVASRITDENVELECTRHGNINTCGYVKKTEYTYDFAKIKAWEKNHPRR